MNREKGFMSDEVFNRIIDECSKIKDIESIEPQMMGEPTLVKDLVSKLKHIRKKVPWAKINLITNGFLLTKEILQEADHVDISFNYADADSFYQGTGLDFDKVYNNILGLKEFKNRISIHFVLTKDKWRDYFRIKKLFPEYQVSVNPLFNVNRGAIKDLNLHIFNKRIFCDKLKIQLPILWNGDGVLCCNDYEGETAKYIGNIKKRSLLELYNCDYLKKMREKDEVLDYKGTFCERCNGNMEVKWSPSMLEEKR